MATELAKQLEQASQALGQSLSARQSEQLLTYLELLSAWNQLHNLTAITEPTQMLTHHLSDSLAVLPYLRGQRLVDVGSGAGLPGVPLAITRPEISIVLLDSNRKKIRFLTHVVGQLGLGNVEVAHSRAEDYAASPRFATVIARAFAALPDFVAAAAHLCAADGCLLAMRAKLTAGEKVWRGKGFQVTAWHSLTIPGLNAERNLLCLQPLNEEIHD